MTVLWVFISPNSSVDDLHDALVDALTDIDQWDSSLSHPAQQQTCSTHKHWLCLRVYASFSSVNVITDFAHKLSKIGLDWFITQPESGTIMFSLLSVTLARTHAHIIKEVIPPSQKNRLHCALIIQFQTFFFSSGTHILSYKDNIL